MIISDFLAFINITNFFLHFCIYYKLLKFNYYLLTLILQSTLNTYFQIAIRLSINSLK